MASLVRVQSCRDFIMLLLCGFSLIKSLRHVIRRAGRPNLRHLLIQLSVCHPRLDRVGRRLVSSKVLEVKAVHHHRERALFTLTPAPTHDLNLLLHVAGEKGEQHVQTTTGHHVLVVHNEIDAAPKDPRR